MTLSSDGEMQRRLPVFEPRHPAVQGFRVLFSHLTNQIQVSHRYCRKDVVTSAAFHEDGHHARPYVIRRSDDGRPANHLGFMDIALPVHVGACVEQRPNGFGVPSSGGEVQRRGVVSDITSVRISTMLQQQTYRFDLAARSGGMQTGAAI